MCGLIGGAVDSKVVEDALGYISHRGPDARGVGGTGPWALGHTRLAIQGTQSGSDQPVFLPGVGVLTYNGEIWDPASLASGIEAAGDTPHVAALLAQDGRDALWRLQGMWALAWTDAEGLHLARDEFGEVPLHYGYTRERRLVWASEIAALLALGADPSTVKWFPPGHVLTVEDPARPGTMRRWVSEPSLVPTQDESAETVRGLLTDGVESRMVADDGVEVAVLLSGGLDSSATAAILTDRGYSIRGYLAVHDPRASDVKHARAVASHLGIDLTEVRVSEPSREDLARAVRIAEMPHKAQVEITAACEPLARALAADGVRVVLSGEGSDELWASYGMAYHGIAKHGWGPFRRGLFTGQHRKNFSRVNKVFMRHGVEARMPFLHSPLARHALRLSQEAVTRSGRHPKAILAEAVEDLLPAESVWRAKKAFQTDAGLDRAAASAVANPGAFYKAEFATAFRGVKP